MTESTDNTTTQPLDLDALKALEQAASPAPWTANRPSAGEGWTLDTGEDVSHIAAEVQPCDDHPGRDEADADLIAAMRNQLPALLSALAKVTAERDEARREVHLLKHTDDGRLFVAEGMRRQAERDLAAARREAEQAQAELTDVTRERHQAVDLLRTIWYGTVNAPARERWLRLIADATPAAAPKATTEHTVWDHYGPCDWCGVTTGPCLNPDNSAPWPIERRVPAPKPHPRRRLADAAAPKADERKLTMTRDRMAPWLPIATPDPADTDDPRCSTCKVGNGLHMHDCPVLLELDAAPIVPACADAGVHETNGIYREAAPCRCIHHQHKDGQVTLIEDLCCPLHGVDAKPGPAAEHEAEPVVPASADGDWMDPSTPGPGEARVLYVAAGAGDGEQDATTGGAA